ncbi:MAG: PHB depolymerase family esterase [Thermoguttaceae bacterium]|jgi:pimeloyl-ACP methyl ester carboxylesterase
MRPGNRSAKTSLLRALVCLAAWSILGPAAGAAEVLMKDGRILRGSLGEVLGLSDAPAVVAAGRDNIKQIIFLDDDLRRIYVSKRQVQEVKPDVAGHLEEKFHVRQRPMHSGAMVHTVGPALRIQPFDEYGRRIFTFSTTRAPLDIIQGITEITPQWTKVEGINFMWDMRIATSSIPSDVLHKILVKQIDPKNIEHRKRIARFYIESERYDDARKELEAIVADFPQNTEVRQQLQPTIQDLRRLSAKTLLAELKLRREAGQHELVQAMLKKFPTEGVPGEILQAVRELIREYEDLEARRAKVVEQLNALAKQISDPAQRPAVESARREIAAELGIDTLARMASFLQNADFPNMTAEDKAALAISGWLLGADAATDKLPLALSTYRVRDLMQQYLAEPVKLQRAAVKGHFNAEEAAKPATLAALAAAMKPPLELPDTVADDTPGYFKLEAPAATKELPITYYLQLPPEYNPYRRYPLIVTLHGSGNTAEQQVDWWAGAWAGKRRSGQAARYGYVVLAPEWAAENQKQYDYSGHEHAAVLNCLRDACRRFAIDTDRVFLSGHSMGGDAAWDMGLAHPDLWAGVIPIVAEADRYCAFYWENARWVPFYVVGGELDGNKFVKNSRDLDRYLKHGYNTTVVEYQGRGHEHFYDEALHLFDWMGRFKRDFFLRDFSCVTMRQWDSFFWWVEVGGLPSGALVNPTDWPPPRGTQPAPIKGSVTANNNLNVRTGTTKVTVWLAPQMVDFKSRVSIMVNGRRMNNHDPTIKPSLETMLEDIRARGDRQHPFWAKLEAPTGRLGGE